MRSDSEGIGFTRELQAPEHSRCRDSRRNLCCEHSQPGQYMFNRSARAAVSTPQALPLRQAVMSSFRSRVKFLPLPPDSLPELMAGLQAGIASTSENAAGELRRGLFHAPGREAEGQNLWREAVATSAFASQLAQEQGASVAVAACAGLLHRVGEAFALRSMALAESEHGVRIDSPSKSALCMAHGRDLAERLVREWELPPAVGVCVVGWRRFGEFAAVSPEAGAVYVGHVLSGELLHPYLTATGALDAADSELGMCSAAIARVRAQSNKIRELVCTLE